MQILVIEDDVDIAELVAFNLERQGWDCALVHHGAEGWEMIQRRRPDLVILDVMLPGMDGMQIFRAMKENEMTRGIPVIFLTARGELDDRLEGLSMGADDYVTKPFSMRELMARVRTSLRRYAALTHSGETETVTYEAGELVLEADRFAVRKRGRLIDLTQKETDLLKFFMSSRGQVFGRAAIFEAVWGYEALGDERTVDVTIRRLREKIEDEPGMPVYILTKRGVGYYFNEEIGKN